MGNYFSAWDEMLDRWIEKWADESVLTTEHPALTFEQHFNREDGADMVWDAERRSALNRLEFCSMVGHDADVRSGLFPNIEERLRVCIDIFLRAEYDFFESDESPSREFQNWDLQDIFDIWSIWRMCNDLPHTYATGRVEIANNFGFCGDYGDVVHIVDVFDATWQGGYRKHTTKYELVTYEGITFPEFAIRLYMWMHYLCGREQLVRGEEEEEEEEKEEAKRKNQVEDEEKVELPEWPGTIPFIEELMLEVRLRRAALPVRCKALFSMW